MACARALLAATRAVCARVPQSGLVGGARAASSAAAAGWEAEMAQFWNAKGVNAAGRERLLKRGKDEKLLRELPRVEARLERMRELLPEVDAAKMAGQQPFLLTLVPETLARNEALLAVHILAAQAVKTRLAAGAGAAAEAQEHAAQTLGAAMSFLAEDKFNGPTPWKSYGVALHAICAKAVPKPDKKAGVPHRCFLRRPLAAEMKDEEVEGQPPQNAYEMYVDIGVYGLPKCVHEGREDEYDMRRSMRAVEDKVQKADGFSMLYADIYMSKEEFEVMFDHDQYRQLRKKYGAENSFKEVYDKMNSRY